MKILCKKGYQRWSLAGEKWENLTPVVWREEFLGKLPWGIILWRPVIGKLACEVGVRGQLPCFSLLAAFV
jgi:hypothetical protein